ncbi:hypothetical protein ACN27G_15840 [Plantactinospora sp. WMMB334]|uniref:hypothetical protein n=1 Tax=Plantactinospora sp. WMMB334 TaxID=3404119 RepID=UPI003B9255B0
MRQTHNSRHHRAWWWLWLRCRCGGTWRCPAVPAPPPELFVRPMTEAEYRAGRELSAPKVVRYAPAPLPSDRYDGWNNPTWARPAPGPARADNLSPAQEHRARHTERM